MSRKLDAAVAEALGLDVIGNTWSSPDPEIANYWFPTGEESEYASMEPVYLRKCTCHLHEEEEAEGVAPGKTLGHYWTCLDVVPFYSEYTVIAMELEPHMPYFNLRRMVSEKWWQCQSAFCGDVFNHIVDHCGCQYGDAITPAEAICLAFLKARGVDWREEER